MQSMGSQRVGHDLATEQQVLSTIKMLCITVLYIYRDLSNFISVSELLPPRYFLIESVMLI